MVDPTPSDYNLTYLRERWDRDRSSRIFLQLAEEYRRRGLHAEALEVLETGLGFHPGYLAAQVALGRCRLEAGQPEAAVKVLERVLTQDPTQVVATRLLAETWLQLGDEERAQAALDRCRLIGIPPSELVGLEQRMAAAKRAARDRWPEPPAEAPGAAAAPAAEEAREEEPVAWPAVPEPQPWPRATAAVAESAAPAGSSTSPVEETPRPEPPLPATAAAEPAPGPGHVFSLPPRAARGVVLPLRPGAERKVVGARGNPFGSVARPRPRPPEAAEIFRLLPPAAPPGQVVSGAGAAPAAAAAGPAEAAPPRPLASPTPDATTAQPAPAGVQLPVAPPAVAPPPVAPPPAAPPAASTAPADRWWAPATKPVAPAPPAAAIPPPAASAPAVPAPPAPASRPAAAAARTATPAAARWWERPIQAPAEEAPPTPPAAVAAPTPAAAATAPAPTPSTAPPVAPPAPTPAAAVPPAAVAAASPLAGAAGVELQPSGTLAVPELRPSDPGTATLGELYLRQGYVQEAEEIFKQVLARDAENEAALAGLEAIGRRRAQKLTAAELIAGDEDTEVLGLTARKIQLLNRYLGKLRRGA